MNSGPRINRKSKIENRKSRDLGFAKVDLERAERCGRPEVIYCEGKLPEQVAEIAHTLFQREGFFLGTRANADQYAAVRAILPQTVFHARARCLTLGSASPESLTVGLISAGTADEPVSEEAAITLETFGWKVKRIADVGVAGLHRLMAQRPQLNECQVLIVVAGMEGALPSVVAGLTDQPLIAVPTSVGYGASFQGLAALLGMLTSCGSRVTVVNIDNGFGAACAADAILRLVVKVSTCDLLCKSPTPPPDGKRRAKPPR